MCEGGCARQQTAELRLPADQQAGESLGPSHLLMRGSLAMSHSRLLPGLWDWTSRGLLESGEAAGWGTLA